MGSGRVQVAGLNLRLDQAVCLGRWGSGVTGWGSSGSTAGLDVLTALHLWFVLSGLHLDVDHVVARRHVALLALRHLLLGDDPVDLCRGEETDH